MKKNKVYISDCCHAKIRWSDPAPDFPGDDPKTMKIGTVYAICTKCGEPCNFYIPTRKFWTRNPKTQIQGDKREKEKIKQAKKEIGCA